MSDPSPADTVRNVVLAGYYGSGNAGDEAILSVLLAHLRQAGLTVTVVSSDPAMTEADHGIHAVNWRDPAQIDRSIAAADAVFIGGGGLFHDHLPFDGDGALHRDHNGIARCSTIALLAALHGKPLGIVAVGVGPLNSSDAVSHTLTCFELASAAMVRDDHSKKLLAQAEPPAPTVGADPAFLLDLPTPEETAAVLAAHNVRGRPVIGVALRAWQQADGTMPWEGEVARALDELLTGSEPAAVFVPFQQGSWSLANDAAAATRVVEMMHRSDQAVILPETLSPRTKAGVLASCDVVVAMRLHAVLFAALGGAPPIGLVYDDKVALLLEQMGLGQSALRLERVTAAEIVSLAHAGLADRDAAAEHLHRQVERLRTTAGTSLSEVVTRVLASDAPRPSISDSEAASSVLTRSLMAFVHNDAAAAETTAEIERLKAQNTRLQAKLQKARGKVARLEGQASGPGAEMVAADASEELEDGRQPRWGLRRRRGSG